MEKHLWRVVEATACPVVSAKSVIVSARIFMDVNAEIGSVSKR